MIAAILAFIRWLVSLFTGDTSPVKPRDAALLSEDGKLLVDDDGDTIKLEGV